MAVFRPLNGAPMKTLLAAFAACGVAALASAATAQTPAPPSLDEALARIAAYAPQALAEQGAPGMSVTITDRTHTLKILALGYANVDAKLPVTADTRFPIGSITKSMTATALLELRDAGRLDPNATVQHYLPWFSIDAGGKPILVHQILSHTAGLPDDFAQEIGNGYNIASLRNARVIFAPGTSWSYSNDGYATAGAILSALDGKPWPQAVTQRVFTPIGMSRTSAVFTAAVMADDTAIGYQFRDMDRPPPPAPALLATPYMDFVDSAGSVIAPPEDMARYMRFILNGGVADGKRVLSETSFKLLTTPDTNGSRVAGAKEPELAEAPEMYRKYAFGLSVETNGSGDHIVGHTGGIEGYTACMKMNLTRGFGVIAQSNLIEAPLHPCAIVRFAMEVLAAQALGKPLPPVPSPKDPLRVAAAPDFAGTFAGPNGTLKITADGTRLTLHAPSGDYPLYPRGGDSFWTADPRFTFFTLDFSRDKGNAVVEVHAGPEWFHNGRYRGAVTFAYPHAWDAYAGRYENEYAGSPYVSRVYVLKGKLTVDGAPLTVSSNGTFRMGTSIVKFGMLTAGRPQELSIDDSHLYRIDLP